MTKKMTVDLLFDYLKTNNELRLRRIGVNPYAELLGPDGRSEYKVPSKNFIRAVDEIMRDSKLPLQTPDVMTQLCNIIQTITTEVSEDTVEDSSVQLEELLVKQNPHYIARRYEDTTDVELVKAAAKAKMSALSIGPSGAGKSMLFKQSAYELQLPFLSVDLSESFDSQELLGAYYRHGDTWVFRKGKLPSMMEHGGIIVLEEINASRADVLTRFHSIWEDDRSLTLLEDQGQTIYAVDNFMVCGTMNDRDAGSRQIPARLKERFGMLLIMDYDPEVEAKIPGVNGLLLQTWQLMRANPKIRTPISTRLLVTFIKNIKVHGNKIAVKLLYNMFKDNEKDAVTEAFKQAYANEAKITVHPIEESEQVVNDKAVLIQPAR